jgi:beta propeller repeat protein
MKTKIKLRSFALTSIFLVLFLILVSSVASASISETRITNHGTANSPAIYGNTIVWQDSRNGNWDIYIQDLSNNKQIHTTNQSNQTEPAIYNNNVVWVDFRNGGSEIYMQDLSTSKQTRITKGGESFVPAIYGNRIVWDMYAANDDESWYDLYMYDFSTKKQTKIPTMKSSITSAIYGDKIVWLDTDTFSGGDYYIYTYDLSTKKRTLIDKVNRLVFFIDRPTIYGNRIVWSDDSNGNRDIYMYDLSTKKKTQITTDKSDQQNPAIYGNTIVWQDNRSGNWDIYAYDLVTHQQVHTTDKSDQMAPAIYGDKVVWIDYRSGKPDVYMGTISYLPVANFTASPTSGTHPLNVQFNDKSTDVYYWTWDFGDKTTSTLSSPTHKYSKAGKYTVTLTVKNAAGKNTTKKTNYITVK